MKKIVLFIVVAFVVNLSANAQNTTQASNVRKATTAAILSEGFESWDGSSWDWLPEGWTDESKVGSNANYEFLYSIFNFTWATTNKTQSGTNCAMVFRSLDGNPQDEWLISPLVTIDRPNLVLTFDLNYNPSFMRMDVTSIYPLMVFTAMNNLVGVYISIDGGTTWEKKWDVTEHANHYTEEELYSIYETYYWVQTAPDELWNNFSIDLKDYFNKDIQIAIRYESEGSGTSVYVDNITIDGPTGLHSINPVKNVKVTVQADRFVLSYPAGTTSVAIYNVTGQKIAEYALNPGGKQSISTAGLSKGVYILKFAGKTGETVKVIK